MAEGMDLVLAIFQNEETADAAADELKQWAEDSADLVIGGVGILVQDDTGRIKEERLGHREAASGARIGMVLGILAAAIAAVPTGGLSFFGGAAGGAAAGGLIGAFFHAGFHVSPEDAEQLHAQLSQGHAALGVMTSPLQTGRVADKLEELGGVVETHEISAEAQETVASAHARE